MKSFVSDQERELVLGLLLGRISEDEFLISFPGIPQEVVVTWLERATRECDPLGVEFALYVGHRFSLVEACLPYLLVLATADWHQRHEDVVGALSELRALQSVGPLYEAAKGALRRGASESDSGEIRDAARMATK